MSKMEEKRNPVLSIDELRRQRRWLPHRNKKPFAAKTGSGLRWNEPQAWTDFITASAAPSATGVGIVVGDGIVVIDLDDCIAIETVNGMQKRSVKPAFKPLFDAAIKLGVYIEVSQSGRGLHILLLSDWKGTLKAKIRGSNAGNVNQPVLSSDFAGGIEIYGGRSESGGATRFIAITGHTKSTGSRTSITSADSLIEDAVALVASARDELSKLDVGVTGLAKPGSSVANEKPDDGFAPIDGVTEDAVLPTVISNTPLSALNAFALEAPHLWFAKCVLDARQTNARRWEGRVPGTGSTNVSLEMGKGIRWWSAESHDAKEGMSPVDMVAKWSDPDDQIDIVEAAARLMDWLRLDPATLRGWATIIAKGTKGAPKDLFEVSPEVAHQWSKGTLPEIFERYAEGVSVEVGCDAGSACFMLLVTCMAAIPSPVRVKPRPGSDWVMPGSVYGALVTRSGGGKGPVMRPFIAALEEVEAQWAKEHRQQLVGQTEESKKALEARGPKKRLTDSPTTEALLQRMEKVPDGVILRAEELSGQIGMIGRSGNGRAGTNPDSRVYLEAYDGGSFDVPRKTEGLSVSISKACLSIIGGIQTIILSKIVDNLSEDGLLQRFMFARMTERPEFGEVCRDEQGKRMFRDVVGRLMRLAEIGGSVEIPFSEAAAASLMAHANHSRGLSRAGTSTDALHSVLSKAHGFIARVAFAFELIDWAVGDIVLKDVLGNEEPTLLPTEVSVGAVERAARWFWGYQWPTLQDVYGDLGFAAESTADVKVLALYLLEHPKEFSDAFTARAFRDLRRFRPSGPDGGEKRQRLFHAITKLEDAGWIKQKGDFGRAPSYVCDPRIWDLFAHHVAQADAA